MPGQVGQLLQVLLDVVLGHRQREHQVDRLAIGGAEVDRLRQPQEGAAAFLDRADARVRDRHAVADRGAGELFARAQAVADGAGGERDR